MDSVLTGYVRALRAAGASTSTAETLDAARAVALVGYADRASLKACLGVTLAKSEDDQRLHDALFDRYFAAPAAPTGDADGRLAAALARAAQAVGVDGIRFSSQVPWFTAQLVAAVEEAAPEALPEPPALQAAARALVQQRFALHGEVATEAFLTEAVLQRPLGRMAPADMARMKTAVQRLARQLAQRHARRRRVTLRGRLDLRRTLHASAAHGGVPFQLHFRTRRVDKPRLVVVCDVSGSVVAHVRFLMLFLYALHDAVGELRSFAFSNALTEVSALLSEQPFDDAMAAILKQAGSGSTDYGQAWVDLLDRYPDAVDGRTTVLVLGDGRSNHTDPRLDRLGEIADRARRLVWLCPEPPGRWGRGDSEMLRLRPLCHHVAHCATVADLERVIDGALAAYG
jgi:uncharacterized protein with von Willebrand factor type A (vWA) domain